MKSSTFTTANATPSFQSTMHRGAVLWALTLLFGAACHDGGGGGEDGRIDAADAIDTASDTGTLETDSAAVDTAADTAEVDSESMDTVDDTALDDTVTDTAADTVTDDTVEPLDTVEPDSIQPDTSPPMCDPALSVTPTQAFAASLELVTFVASGGTGDYVFTLVENGSGASLSPSYGAYLSGPVTGVEDRIQVTDNGCDGVVEASVDVVGALVIEPGRATVPPTTGTFTYAPTGGSGSFIFSLVASESGGSVSSDGVYLAGSGEGQDRVQLLDLGTGERTEAIVDVAKAQFLTLVPSHLAMLTGEQYKIQTSGGSGVVEVTLDNPIVSAVDGWFEALRPGTATAMITDQFTGQQVTATVTVVDSQVFDTVAAGDANVTAVAIAPGDINGDGFDDAIIGVIEADVAALDSGVLHIYAGTADGLSATPVRVISGSDRQDNLGRSAAVADINKDGRLDLMVGIYNSDLGAVNAGAVQVYLGVEDGFFSTFPIQTLLGRNASDQSAYSLSVCDFNGDTWPDLAVGARLAENRNSSPVQSDSGAVRIYFGAAGGYLTQPDVEVYGSLPDEGGNWIDTRSLQLGWHVRTGDLNGDGFCDLVTSAVNYGAAPGRAQDGAVFIYKGQGPSGLSPGGVTALPVKVIASAVNSEPQRFGYSLAVGDIDGDGLDDIVSGAPYWNVDGQRRSGWITVHRGGPLGDTPPEAFTPVTDADWTWAPPGNNRDDYVGWTLEVVDFDGTGPLDIMVGNLQDEMAGSPSNTGVVSVLTGVQDGYPDPVAVKNYPGLLGGERFSMAMATIADRDGDGLNELVVRASYDATVGPRLGANRVVMTATPTEHVALEYPVNRGGSLVGYEVRALADLDGDGYTELAVGAPWAQVDPTSPYLRPGVVNLYRGTATGFASTPFQTLGAFTGHSTQDRFGEAITGLDDFNGDGYSDIAVVASLDDSSSACSPAVGNSGAVHVFFGDGAGGFGAEPGLVYFGDQNGDQLHQITSADVNGDGLSDVIATSRYWDGPENERNIGGAAILLGRTLPTEPARLVVCRADTILLGTRQDDHMGSAVSRIGDLDGDGCEEFAIGARLDDSGGGSNSGTARVVFGFGDSCTHMTPHRVVLGPGVANGQVGYGLAAGEDVDGDGLNDMVVGGPFFRTGGNTIGALWLVTGAYLQTLATLATPWEDLVTPATFYPLIDPASTKLLRLEGSAAAEEFGFKVSLMQGLVAAGRPVSDVAGAPGAGAVSVFRFGADGLDLIPWLGIGGETDRPRMDMGRAVTLTKQNNQPVLVVGAWKSSALGLDEGAAFVVPVPVPTLLP